jgi:hypothetical protein
MDEEFLSDTYWERRKDSIKYDGGNSQEIR